MTIATVITRGFGTFGSVARVVERGYFNGAPLPPVIVPPPTGGAADEPYADVARRKYLEWIRTRRSRSARRLSALPVAPVVVPDTTVSTLEQKQDGLLLRNLHQVRAFAAPVTSVPLASRAPDAREAIARVVAALRQNAEQDDEEAIAFLLENDL